MPGPQYTKCVLPQDYKDYQIAPEIIAAVGTIIITLLTGNIPALITALVTLGSGLSAFREVVNYMLNGKLICLPNGEEICVVGTVANLEEVGQDKNVISGIDNDYSINIILQPFDIEAFFGKPPQESLNLARSQLPQGQYLTAQAGIPLGDDGGPKYGGYFSTWLKNNHTDTFVVYEGDYESDEITSAVKDSELFGKNFNFSPYRIPVLHCECEGSRIRDVLDALDSFPGGGSKFCKKNFLTKFLCKVVATLFAPYIVAKLLYNWLAATGGDPRDARLDPGSGEIEVGDTLLIRGRWVYDAAHSGYNEVHAVKTIQKVLPHYAGFQFPPEVFDTLYQAWCGLTGVVALVSGPATAPSTGSPSPGSPGKTPPDKPPLIKPKPQNMTPAQEKVYDSQCRPENRWHFHPLLDGCAPKTFKP